MRDNEKMIVKKGLETEYEEYVNKNQDGYGNACIVAGAAVGKLLDDGKTPEEAGQGLNDHDLTGFMAGVVASAIFHFHPRGDEFNKTWNKKWGVEDAKGTINPAILNVKI